MIKNREDLIAELASDQVSQVQDLLAQGDYRAVHEWLQPIFARLIAEVYARQPDEALAAYHADQLGEAP